MKNLLYAILLMLPCVSISQTLDSLKIAPGQVINVYQGLRAYEHYKAAYTECSKAVDSLNSIVIEQDYNLNDLVRKIQDYNAELTELYKQREALLTKPRKSWWWLYAAGGILTGILIAK